MFLLSGDGVMKSHLKMRANALGLCNVRFLPVQEHADFLEMLAAIDMALIVQQSAVSDIVFPSKTVTLLSAARPVVASVSANCEIGRVIRQSQAGVVIEPESPDPLVAAIRDMFENPEGRFAMGQRGRRYALQHWDEARILDAFDSKLLEASAVG
jgi:colanic acid biosynthesis glycosyl transferase WcaI